MKRILLMLLILAIVVVTLVACGRNNNNSNNSDTAKNDGKITETGTDSNIIDRAESMMDDVQSDMLGTDTK